MKSSDDANSNSDIKKIGEIIFKEGLAILPGGEALHSLLRLRAEQTADYVRRRNEQRIEAFHQRILLMEDGSLDQTILESSFDEADFHALLSACVTDIESEKVDDYAGLTKSIALGRVPKELRRHFILALRDLAAAELSRMRSAYVATKHELIPARGPRLEPAEFLASDRPGSLKSIAVGNLTAKGFVQQGKLTPSGLEFVQACSTQEQLTPQAVGQGEWTGHHVAVISYEMGSPPSNRWIDEIQSTLDLHRTKSTCLAVLRDNFQQARLPFSEAILVLGPKTERVAENVEYLQHFARFNPIVALALDGVDVPDGLPVTEIVHAKGRPPKEVTIDVLNALARAILASVQARKAAAPPAAQAT